MPGSIVKSIHKVHFTGILLSSLIVFVSVSFLIWNSAKNMNQKRLMLISEMINIKIQENTDFLNRNPNHPEKLKKLLQPYLKKIIQYCPPDFTIGFYSKNANRVIIEVSNNRLIKHNPYVLPCDKSGRYSWKIKKPFYTLVWSKTRRNWILKCDTPLVINGQVIGHSFANITLFSLISLYHSLTIGILVVILLSVGVVILTNQSLDRKIRTNVQHLLGLNNNLNFIFDYEEFHQIAQFYQQSLKDIEKAESYKTEILSNFPWGYAIINSAGMIVDINKNGATALGVNPEDVIGTTANGWDAVLWTIQNKTPVSQEYKLVNQKNGAKKYFYSYCFPINLNFGETGAMNWFLDITQSKQLEESLRNEQERLLITLRSIGDGVIATNKNGQIILINDAAEKITGYKQDEAIGELLEKVLYVIDDHTSEPIDYNSFYNDKLRTRLLSKNLVLINKDLQELSVFLNCTPIHSSTEENTGMVLVFRDITEKLKTDKELLKSEKLESLGILAGGIAHDFNNILAAIIANIQLATFKLQKGDSIEKYLNATVEITQKATNLTKQLLTFAKGDTLVKKSTSIDQLIQDTAIFVLHGSKVKCIFNMDKDLWNVDIDEGQIGQVIQNLVINAKQAMPKGGVIRIAARNVFLDSENYQPGKYIKLTIKDNGMGISRENLNRIFDPFFTTKNEGTGLGLATSYSIIKKHDGYIEVDSQTGVGTSFFIYLPASSNEIKEIYPVNETIAASNDGFRILLMDDEEMILKVVGETLAYYGHLITQAKDGREAIEKYQKELESDHPFDVVIMDLTVPGGMVGQEAIAHLRDIDPNVKAIVSSGYANDPIIAEYERYGFCGVVAKPYKFDELIRTIERVVSKNQLKLDLGFSKMH